MSDPPITTMPIPPPSEPRKRRWLLPTAVGVGGLLLGLGVGIIAVGGDDQTPDASAPPRPRPPTVSVTAPVAPPVPAPAGGFTSDGGWTLSNFEVRADGNGRFSAVGRVTNESGQAVQSAVFSLSVLDPASGGVVAMMYGIVPNVDDGQTVALEFVSFDDYLGGDWTYELTAY